MFSSKPVARFAAVTEALAPKQHPSRPQRKELHDVMLTEEYRAIAIKHGMAIDGLSAPAARVRDELAKMGLAPFALNEVTDYLTKQYGEPVSVDSGQGWRTTQSTWCWKPLRECDLDKDLIRSMKENRQFGWDAQSQQLRENASLVRWTQYLKPVPFPVLLTVDRLATAIPTGLMFFVSDEAPKMPPQLDPFLAVLAGDQLVVIEQWDEPGFQGRRQ